VLYSEYSQGISLALDGSGQAHIAYRQQWYDETWLQYIVWSNQLNDWTRLPADAVPGERPAGDRPEPDQRRSRRIATFLYGSPTTPTYFYETAPNQWSSEAFGPAGGIYVEPSVAWSERGRPRRDRLPALPGLRAAPGLRRLGGQSGQPRRDRAAP